MKKIIYFLFLFQFVCNAQVGVNTTTPNAMLDIQSTDNGILIPRVQLTSILDNTTVVNPNTGALITSTLIYNIAAAGTAPNNVVAGFYYWNNDTVPPQWIPIARSFGWNLNGNTAITSPANPAIYGTSTIAGTENFMGTTDNNDVTFGTNNIERMRIKTTTGNVGIGTATAPAKLSVSSVFASPTIPNTATNAILRIGNNNEGLDIGKAGVTDNFSSWLQSGYNGSTDPLSLQPLGGNVGIATTNPALAKFQVDGVEGSTSALFRGSATSQGISMVADWPGIYFNSYYNVGIRSMAGSGYASIINTDQSTGGLTFQTTNIANTTANATIASIPTRMTITGSGNVGINEPNPSRLLHVTSTTSGAVRIVDGTQANGRILTSNATGVATWQRPGIENVVGTLNGTGVNIPYNLTNFVQTGSSITLPPGRYAVNVTMLLARNSTTLPSPNNSFFWVRSSFSDSSLANPLPSPDIIGSSLASGNFGGTSVYAMLTGTIIINNTTAGNKTYYYVAGRCVYSGTTETLTGFGSSYWAEDNIIAYRLN